MSGDCRRPKIKTAAGTPAQPAACRAGVFVPDLLTVLLVMAIAVLIAAIVVEEMRSSRLQARYLSRLAADLHYELQPGPSAHIRFQVKGRLRPAPAGLQPPAPSSKAPPNVATR